MAFSLNGPNQPLLSAIDQTLPVDPTVNQYKRRLSSPRLSSTSPTTGIIKWSSNRPELVSAKSLLASGQEQNVRERNGLLPAIQFSTSTLRPSKCSSEKKISFPLRILDKSHNNSCGFTPLPPELPIPCTKSNGPSASNQALVRHMQAYLPRIQEANRALQYALANGREEAFQKPLPPVLPMFRPLWNRIQAANGISGSAVTSNPRLQHLIGGSAKVTSHKAVASVPTDDVEKQESERRYCRDLKKARNFEGYWRASTDIERNRLRPPLLWHARQPYGQQIEKELLSLSFYDLTPDSCTGADRNELVLHFEAALPRYGNGKTELMLYESNSIPVDFLQQQHVKPDKKQPGTEIQRWIYFYISCPLITFSKSAISTVANSTDPEARLGPPDLTLPAPKSRLTFATPIEHIIAHPATEDNLASRTLASRSIFTPRAPPHSFQQRTVLRRDFDFLGNSSLIFEYKPNVGRYDWFASKLDIEELRSKFLGARGMRAYDAASDAIAPPILESPVLPSASEFVDPKGDPEYCEESSAELEVLILQYNAERKLHKEKEKRVTELPLAMARNRWWHEVRDGIVADAKAWQRIQEAMARGCCRVVAREVEDPEGLGMDVILGRGAEDSVPARTGLKRSYPARPSGKGSVLCRGLDRGRGPSSLSGMERGDDDRVDPLLEMGVDGEIN